MRRETVVPQALDEVWRVVSDPAQLPRWWPGVTRVEEATPQAWTTVLTSPKGKSVRMDYSRVSALAPTRLVWRQEVDQTPFERILEQATTSLELSEADAGTRVAIELEQLSLIHI